MSDSTFTCRNIECVLDYVDHKVYPFIFSKNPLLYYISRTMLTICTMFTHSCVYHQVIGLCIGRVNIVNIVHRLFYRISIGINFSKILKGSLCGSLSGQHSTFSKDIQYFLNFSES